MSDDTPTEPISAVDAVKKDLRYKYLGIKNGWPGTYSNYTNDWQPIHKYGPGYIHVLSSLAFGAATYYVFRRQKPLLKWVVTGSATVSLYVTSYNLLLMVSNMSMFHEFLNCHRYF